MEAYVVLKAVPVHRFPTVHYGTVKTLNRQRGQMKRTCCGSGGRGFTHKKALRHLQARSSLHYPHHSWVFKHVPPAQSSSVAPASATQPRASTGHIHPSGRGGGAVAGRWLGVRRWRRWLSELKKTTAGVFCGAV